MNSLGLTGRPEDNRVVVAMSGGVDSSVVAALLQREGYQVLGLTLQLYDHGRATKRTGSCCASQDVGDARKVAATLGMPHYVMNHEKHFHEKVILPFAQSYAAGETPVPCISCNQKVKFVDLLQMSRELGASALATGHYVRSLKRGSLRSLHRPVDTGRDQSYFLFTITPEQLDYLRFPLGDFHKERVREIAEEMKLPVAAKPDSQDICFVPEGKYTDMVSKFHQNACTPGDIVHIDGQKLGEHEGIFHYTVGQRRGLRVSSSQPLYVVRIDASRARVIVGPENALATRFICLKEVNWLCSDKTLEEACALEVGLFVRVRSTRALRKAKMCGQAGSVCIELAEEEKAVAPGQACVFYESDAPDARILGGGFILKTAYGRDEEMYETNKRVSCFS